MVADATCGDARQLRGLLEDRLPPREQDRLIAHLEACEACRLKLDHLAAEDRWWDDLRAIVGQGPPPSTRDGAAAGTATLGRAPEDRADLDATVLEFLDRSEEPVALGRFGPYLVLEVLGRGGMGVVLKARDPALDRLVAVKVLAPQLAIAATARLRFTREAKAAASVCHDHVVSIYAVDQFRGLPFLVMPYVPGKSLQERIDQDGPLELKEILRIGMQAARGLSAAHAQGLIHRDIKPANILLENGVERVRITDFGLALVDDDASLTRSGFVAGTPQYMAPEQARGEAVDPRADLFSLGSVLYAMATGHPPFRASSVLAVLRRVSDEDPPPIRERNPDIPGWLVAIIARLHAKDPARRFQTADEVAEVLGRHLARLQLPQPDSPSPDQPASARSRSLPRLAAALLLVAGLGASEAAGISHVSKLVATILRIQTPDGTLVVQVDDPDVSVGIDDDTKEIVVAGAGIHEVRLHPGRHRVQATKGGRTIRSELIAITRGGKQLVRISQEPAPGPVPRGEALDATPAPGPPPGRELTLRPFRSIASLDAEVWAVAYSPDGARLLWGGRTSRLCACEPPDGPPRDIDTNCSTTAIAFAPDGRTFAKGDAGGTIKIWDAGSKRLLTTLHWQGGKINALAFSPDGKALAIGGEDRRVVVLDLASGGRSPAPPEQALPVSRLQFTPDGKTLVVATGDWEEHHKAGEVTLWDAANAAPRGVLWGHTGRIAALAISPDGRTIAVGGADGIRLWDVASTSVVAALRHDDWQVNDLAFSPGGRFLASGYNRGDVVLWEVASRRKRAILEGHEGVVTSLSFAPDGRTIAAGGYDKTLKLWDLSSKPGLSPATGIAPDDRAIPSGPAGDSSRAP